MKFFRQFIVEALETVASSQAKQMGLQGNGHGDWYDSQGNLVAKTVGGKLKVFKGRGGKGPRDESETKPQQKKSTLNINTQQKNISKEQDAEQSTGIVVVFGRFNPPSKNHEQLLKFGLSRAKESGYDYRIYPSRIQDAGTNPLNPSLKIQFMQLMYPEYADYILDSEDAKTIFNVLESLYGDGYRDVKLVVGSDRLGEFQSLAHRNAGQGYEFDNIEVMSASIRDPDSDTAGAGSSVALRTAASQGDYDTFASNLPIKMKSEYKQELYNSVVKSMQRGESLDLWRIAPELDMETLRVNYKKNNLYPIGSIVENLNTGLTGRVLRRGTNYLICVTEGGVMFKSWLQNIREYTYEVGTDKYREKLQSMIDGQPVKSFTGISIKETMPKNLNKIRKDLQKVK